MRDVVLLSVVIVWQMTSSRYDLMNSRPDIHLFCIDCEKQAMSAVKGDLGNNGASKTGSVGKLRKGVRSTWNQ